MVMAFKVNFVVKQDTSSKRCYFKNKWISERHKLNSTNLGENNKKRFYISPLIGNYRPYWTQTFFKLYFLGSTILPIVDSPIFTVIKIGSRGTWDLTLVRCSFTTLILYLTVGKNIFKKISDFFVLAMSYKKRGSKNFAPFIDI